MNSEWVSPGPGSQDDAVFLEAALQAEVQLGLRRPAVAPPAAQVTQAANRAREKDVVYGGGFSKGGQCSLAASAAQPHTGNAPASGTSHQAVGMGTGCPAGPSDLRQLFHRPQLVSAAASQLGSAAAPGPSLHQQRAHPCHQAEPPPNPQLSGMLCPAQHEPRAQQRRQQCQQAAGAVRHVLGAPVHQRAGAAVPWRQVWEQSLPLGAPPQAQQPQPQQPAWNGQPWNGAAQQQQARSGTGPLSANAALGPPSHHARPPHGLQPQAAVPAKQQQLKVPGGLGGSSSWQAPYHLQQPPACAPAQPAPVQQAMLAPAFGSTGQALWHQSATDQQQHQWRCQQSVQPAQPVQAHETPQVQQAACKLVQPRLAHEPGWCSSHQEQLALLRESEGIGMAGQRGLVVDGSGDIFGGAESDQQGLHAARGDEQPQQGLHAARGDEQPQQEGCAAAGEAQGQRAIGKEGQPQGPCAARTSEQPPPLERAVLAPQPAAVGELEAGRKPGRLRQLFDYLVVFDLEATCDQEKKLQPQEIIELSCVVVDTGTLMLGARFQQYVRPTVHPRLTDFCTQLTGITQDTVDGGTGLEAALERLTAWLKEQGLLGQGKSFVPVTWNDWDMKIQMDSECKWRKLQKPRYMARWIDLKAVFVKHYNKRCNLRKSVEHAGLEWEGRAHSGIDDAANTARLAVKLMQRGLVLGITGSFSGVDASGKMKQSTLFEGRVPAKRTRIYDDSGKWNGKCSCGVKAKKRTVKRPGPTNGKDFWSCGRYTVTGGARCDFFKWVDAPGK